MFDLQCNVVNNLTGKKKNVVNIVCKTLYGDNNFLMAFIFLAYLGLLRPNIDLQRSTCRRKLESVNNQLQKIYRMVKQR